MPASPSAADVFGRSAEEYELGRPAWPSEAVDRLCRELGLGPEARVLDLAAGTGKLTRALAGRFAHVVAVEPDDAMRAVLERGVPGVAAYRGFAEQIPLPDSSFDVVFAAEAFHWFDGDRALAEIGRVLRPRGGLGLLWNVPRQDVEPPLPESVEQMVEDIFSRGFAPGGPRYVSGVWREPFARSRFGELHEASVPYELDVDRDTLVANLLSISTLAALPDDERTELGRRFRELIPDQTYRRFLHADLYWARLSGGS